MQLHMDGVDEEVKILSSVSIFMVDGRVVGSDIRAFPFPKSQVPVPESKVVLITKYSFEKEYKEEDGTVKKAIFSYSYGTYPTFVYESTYEPLIDDSLLTVTWGYSNKPMHPLEPKEAKKVPVVCIYVVQGKQVDKQTTTEHPGMDSFEREFGDVKKKRALFSWDHMDLKGQHIFIGHLL